VIDARERIWAYDRSAQQAHPSLSAQRIGSDDCGQDGCGDQTGLTLYGISAVNRAIDSRQIAIGRLLFRNLPADPEDIVGLRNLESALGERISGGDWLENFYNSLVCNPGSPLAAGDPLARFRVLQVALRILSKGAPFPAELPDMGKITTDPYTNKPLAYRRTEDGFVLYSLGPSGNYSDPTNPYRSSPLSFQYPYVPPPKPVAPVRQPGIPVYSDDDDD
jgi:hypothetical protein